MRTSHLTSKQITNQIAGPARRAQLRCHETRQRAGSAGATCETAYPRRDGPRAAPPVLRRRTAPAGSWTYNTSMPRARALSKRVAGSLRRARAGPQAADTGGTRETPSAAEPADSKDQRPAARVRCNAGLGD